MRELTCEADAVFALARSPRPPEGAGSGQPHAAADRGAETRRRRHAFYKRALPAIDVLAGAAALVVAHPGRAPRAAELLTLVLIPVLAAVAGLYRRDAHLLHTATLDETPALLQVSGLYALLMWLLLAATSGSELPAGEVAAVWALLFVFLLAGRTIGRIWMRRRARTERCLLLGDAWSATELQRKFELSFALKATVVGRVPFRDDPADSAGAYPPAPEPMEAPPPVLGGVTELADVVARQDVDRVIVAPDGSDDSLDAIRGVRALGIPVSVLPRMLEVIGSSFELDDVDGVTLLAVRRSGPTRSAAIVKRAIDLTLVGLALAGLAPLFLAIAVAIKLTSPGPVVYRQRRIGRAGVAFDMFKFRSMVDGADALKPGLLERNETRGLFKIADDPRTTRVGRWLRRNSLDELPQLWNVLRGEMSLVGPRPLVPDDDAQIEGWYRMRLNVPPGITGPWQILGSVRSPLEEMVRLDYLYAARWSLWLDVKIMLRTLLYMANGRSS